MYLLRPIALGVVLWRGLRNRLYWVGLGERFGWGDPLPGDAVRAGRAVGSIWVHAVSLGEVTAAAALVHALQARHAQFALIVTTATPTGRARAEALFGAATCVRFLPYDTPGAMRRFLRRAQPRLAIIMETELWPNLFHQCRVRGIPIVLANARLSQTSVRRYGRVRGLCREVLSGDVFIAAQTTADAQRFIALGADPGRTRTIGNLKFDVAVDAAVADRGRELRARFWSGRPVWIAGSTHQGEEEAALRAHAELLSRVPRALLLLVPRHPERFAVVADLLQRGGWRFQRRSSAQAVPADCHVLLIDTMGELASLYAAVDVAFVGGSLVAVGGHNLLEPAALGVPVITGPYQSNAKEVAQLMLREGAAMQVADARELGAAAQDLLTNGQRRLDVGSRGLQVVAANRGSLERLLGVIGPLLARRRP